MNRATLTTLILSILLIFQSCSSDDSTNEDASINFTKAYLSTVDGTFGEFNFQLMLMDSNRTVDLGQSVAEIIGTGPLLYLELEDEINGNLPEAGLYPFDTFGSNDRPLYIDWGWYKTSDIWVVEQNDTFVMTSGNIEISYQGNQMILNYNLNLVSQDDDNITKQISGTYNQQVIVTDVSLW